MSLNTCVKFAWIYIHLFAWAANAAIYKNIHHDPPNRLGKSLLAGASPRASPEIRFGSESIFSWAADAAISVGK